MAKERPRIIKASTAIDGHMLLGTDLDTAVGALLTALNDTVDSVQEQMLKEGLVNRDPGNIVVHYEVYAYKKSKEQ